MTFFGYRVWKRKLFERVVGESVLLRRGQVLVKAMVRENVEDMGLLLMMAPELRVLGHEEQCEIESGG